jgi:hypothetical protein
MAEITNRSQHCARAAKQADFKTQFLHDFLNIFGQAVSTPIAPAVMFARRVAGCIIESSGNGYCTHGAVHFFVGSGVISTAICLGIFHDFLWLAQRGHGMSTDIFLRGGQALKRNNLIIIF